MGRLLLKFDGVLAETFNPLESAAAEILPSQWSGPHVFVRTADAFATLARMPRGAWGPNEIRTCWPEYYDEWADLLAQLGNVGEVEKTWEARNRVILRPSSIEIAGMESALGWPGRYLGNASDMIRALNLVALAHAQDRDLDTVVRFHYRRRRERWRAPRMSEQAWRKMAYVASDVIAHGLIRTREAVF